VKNVVVVVDEDEDKAEDDDDDDDDESNFFLDRGCHFLSERNKPCNMAERKVARVPANW